jgi:glycosyltransferase involved in cell wall biosynthesis
MGGVEVALISSIPLLNCKYSLKIIVLGSIDPKMTSNLTDEEKKVFLTYDYPFYLYPVILPKIVRFVALFSPDILVFSLWRASLAALCIRPFCTKTKFYSFVHNTKFSHLFAIFFIRTATKKADIVLTDSVATSNYVIQQFKPNAEVRIVSFLTRATPATITRPAPSINEEVRFMFLGRISRVKNLSCAIESIAYLRNMSIPATLDIYGRDDGSVPELVKLISKLNLQDYVHFKGEASENEKWELFKQYHFYIQLSLSEGMAMSVTEAMQNGLVCIVSPVGEIVNYATDMQSAIFIDIFKGDTWQFDLQKVHQTIYDKSLYLQISQNCHQYFSGKKLYPESLLEQIAL